MLARASVLPVYDGVAMLYSTKEQVKACVVRVQYSQRVYTISSRSFCTSLLDPSTVKVHGISKPP